MQQALEVKNLQKSYGKFEAVKNISFSVKEGEIFGLIGPNGAGKSTTLKMISTLLSIGNGSISVFEYDVAKQPDKVREIISYLPEEAGAYKNLKGRNYLKLMAALYIDDSQKQKEYVQRGEEISGLGVRLNDKISTYSKGMTRKLLLARTLMSMPKLAIMDEPTSGLDVVNALEVRNIIKEYAKKGMAVLVSSHNMLEVEYLSDSVGIIDKGIIHDIGTSIDLKKKYNANNLEEVFVKATK